MTRRTITLKATSAFKEKYQSLLRKDWSMATLRQVLKLLDELLRASGAALRFVRTSASPSRLAWEESDDAVRNGKIVFDSGDLLELLTIHGRLGLPGMPSLPNALDGAAFDFRCLIDFGGPHVGLFGFSVAVRLAW